MANGSLPACKQYFWELSFSVYALFRGPMSSSSLVVRSQLRWSLCTSIYFHVVSGVTSGGYVTWFGLKKCCGRFSFSNRECCVLNTFIMYIKAFRNDRLSSRWADFRCHDNIGSYPFVCWFSLNMITSCPIINLQSKAIETADLRAVAILVRLRVWLISVCAMCMSNIRFLCLGSTDGRTGMHGYIQKARKVLISPDGLAVSFGL